ncbi:COMM domain-containing protein 3 isoform X1 [Lepisosteus oculatus]|uniref:COMM domain-containing protein 3 n=1 Tax=Lepisosteus oculatus TaxID=7918 RepID=W5N1J7_LEPOC|nr:PREDICTED: COMM domain-containing protein 3 [Lepisosteus oculatus]
MELSEFVQRGLQYLTDTDYFDSKTFTVFIKVAFQSLLSSHSDHAILGGPEFRHVDQTLLKHCHVATTTCILEFVKQNADKSTISTCLEDLKYDPERIDMFCNEYQKNKSDLEHLLASLGRCPPQICDVAWRLEYQIKNSHVHKVNKPSYLITFNVENSGARSPEEIHFSCTMEQLQDLLGKMKDAAKSLEKATQM